MASVRLNGDGINVRTQATLGTASLFAVGRSGVLRRYSDGAAILQPTTVLMHSDGVGVQGDNHGIAPAPSEWVRVWLDGSWRYIARPLSTQRPDHERLAELLNAVYPDRITDPKQVAYAQTRAQEITQSFSHTRPDGTSWYGGVGGVGAGEVIAWNSGWTDGLPRIVAQWQGSAGHNSILSNTRYPYIACGVARSGSRLYAVAIVTTRLRA